MESSAPCCVCRPCEAYPCRYAAMPTRTASSRPVHTASEVRRVAALGPTKARSARSLAGIMGAKQTAALIPLCHPLPLTSASVQLALDEGSHSVLIAARARTVGPTGVEMEALTGVAVAALTVYDMCKVRPLAGLEGWSKWAHQRGGGGSMVSLSVQGIDKGALTRSCRVILHQLACIQLLSCLLISSDANSGVGLVM